MRAPSSGKCVPPPLLSAHNIDLLLRNDPSQFTEEELAALAAMDLDSPTAVQGTAESQFDTVPGCAPDEVARPTTSSTALMRQRNNATDEDTTTTTEGTTTRLGDNPPLTGATLTILTRQDLVGGTDAVADAILQTRHVERIAKGLTSTSSVECFLNATHLYLQENQLVDLDGLQLLIGLQVLVVHHNRIKSLRPIATLDSLLYLDAGHNAIDELQPQWDLPCGSLEYLNLCGNACCPAGADAKSKYRSTVIAACSALSVLDDVDVCASSGGSTTDREESPPPPRPAVDAEPALLVDALTHHAGIGDKAPQHQFDGTAAKHRSSMPASTAPKQKKGSRNRAQSTVEAARHSVGGPACVTAPPKSPSPSPELATTAAGIATEKLWQQHQSLAQTRRRLLAAAGGDDGDTASHGGEGQGLSDLQRLHTKVYEDINYANSIAGSRMRQALEEQWTAVTKVVQTRHGLVQERQRRLRALPNERSQAYRDALELLAQESKCDELDKYRVAGDSDERGPTA